jgi:hypothetical protein
MTFTAINKWTLRIERKAAAHIRLGFPLQRRAVANSAMRYLWTLRRVASHRRYAKNENVNETFMKVI